MPRYESDQSSAGLDLGGGPIDLGRVALGAKINAPVPISPAPTRSRHSCRALRLGFLILASIGSGGLCPSELKTLNIGLGKTGWKFRSFP